MHKHVHARQQWSGHTVRCSDAFASFVVRWSHCRLLNKRILAAGNVCCNCELSSYEVKEVGRLKERPQHRPVAHCSSHVASALHVTTLQHVARCNTAILRHVATLEHATMRASLLKTKRIRLFARLPSRAAAPQGANEIPPHCTATGYSRPRARLRSQRMKILSLEEARMQS
jgi:hypothetical protein